MLHIYNYECITDVIEYTMYVCVWAASEAAGLQLGPRGGREARLKDREEPQEGEPTERERCVIVRV